MLIQKQSSLASAWDDVGSIDDIQIDSLMFNGFESSLDSVLDPNDTLGNVTGNTLFSDTCFSDPPFYNSTTTFKRSAIDQPSSSSFETKRRKVSSDSYNNFDLEEDIAAIEAEITAVAQHKRQLPNISLSSSPTLSFQPLFFSSTETENKLEQDFFFNNNNNTNLTNNNKIATSAPNKQTLTATTKSTKYKNKKRKKKNLTHKEVLDAISNLTNDQMSVVLNILYPNQLKATTNIADLSLDIARLDDVRQGKLRTFLKSCLNKKASTNNYITNNNNNNESNVNQARKKKKVSPKRKKKTTSSPVLVNDKNKELSRAEIFEREEVLILKHVDDEDEFVDIGDSFDC